MRDTTEVPVSPTWYEGRVILDLPPVAGKRKRRVVKVVVDAGEEAGNEFWVHHDDIPEWLRKGMFVTFWLVWTETPHPGTTERVRVATNIFPQRT